MPFDLKPGDYKFPTPTEDVTNVMILGYWAKFTRHTLSWDEDATAPRAGNGSTIWQTTPIGISYYA